MTLAQALALSARGLEAQTDMLRAKATMLPPYPRHDPGPYNPAAEFDWPHPTNRQEIQASRALLSRLIDALDVR